MRDDRFSREIPKAHRRNRGKETGHPQKVEKCLVPGTTPRFCHSRQPIAEGKTPSFSWRHIVKTEKRRYIESNGNPFCMESLMRLRKRLYTAAEANAAINRMAKSIVETCCAAREENFALVGLYQQGVPLAERLCAAIEKLSDRRPPMAKLDISLYRDDFGKRSALPLIRETIMPFDVNDTRIILVDDVLSTGRTIRAALDALTDYGRPGIIRLAVLVDRGNPEFPIRADYVGFACNPPENHKVAVRFDDDDSEESGIYEVEWK